MNKTFPNQTLSQRVVEGGFWVFALKGTQRILGIIRLTILARVLAPHDFGLLGIAMLTLSSLETFSQTGFDQALIQKKDDINGYLNSAWTVLIIRGFILFAILYLIAPYVAIFFDTPEAKPIIQVIGFSILLQAFTNIGIIYFRKELEFNKQFIYQLSGTLADFIVAVSAAYILKSVWALVFGLLAGNFVRFIASYLIHPYRPHLSSDLRKAKELFGFGKWILGTTMLIFLLSQGDDAFVGKLLGATALGFYQMAYKLSNLPATQITHVISEVTFPAYSKLQDDIPRLRGAYLKVLQITAFLSFPAAGLLFVFAPDFIKIILGEKWMPMVPTMQVLCIFGALRAIVATMGPIFLSTGNAKIQTHLSIMQLFIMGILIYPLTVKWGIAGTSATVVLTNIASYWGIKKLLTLIKCKLEDFSRSLFSPMLSTFITVSLLLLFNQAFEANIINLFFRIGLYLIPYIVIIYLLDKIRPPVHGENFKLVKQILTQKNKGGELL